MRTGARCLTPCANFCMFPVEEKIGEIAAALARNRDVVLTAPPGSGKTTCVPPALLDAPWLKGRKIVMLEPRRIAARTCAQYISRKLGEPVGGTVGYQVRLERKVSAKTRLEIVTEGLLANRILADPELNDVGLVIFDEFHERSLPCDLAFALALEVRRALRPDLRLLVMSATLAAVARDEARAVPRRETAGFEHQDLLPREPGLVEKRRRHARRLAAAGRSGQNDIPVRAEMSSDFGDSLLDGKHHMLPMTALMRRTPAEELCSFWILKLPSSFVFVT